MTERKELVSYNKGRINKSSSSPRDRQLRARPNTDLSSGESVLALKEEVLGLKEELLNMTSVHSAKSLEKQNNLVGKLYTEQEFNEELIKALEKEMKQGTIGKESLEHKKLEEDYHYLKDLYEEVKVINIDLEKELLDKDRQVTSLQAKVDNVDALMAAKDETISSLKEKPVVINQPAPEVRYVNNTSQPQVDTINHIKNDTVDIEVETIDPTVNTKLESHLKVKEVKCTETTKKDMQDSLAKLKSLGLGG